MPYAIFGFEALLRFLYNGQIKFYGEEEAGLKDLEKHLPIPEMVIFSYKIKTNSFQKRYDSVSRSLGSLRESSKHYDFKIISGDGIEIPVHKFILASRCEYYSRMLAGNFVESSSDHLKLEESADTLKVPLIKYLI